jgi:hypothetical protein
VRDEVIERREQEFFRAMLELKLAESGNTVVIKDTFHTFYGFNTSHASVLMPDY